MPLADKLDAGRLVVVYLEGLLTDWFVEFCNFGCYLLKRPIYE
jgi:hypothetical protein